MYFKAPKSNSEIIWTKHAVDKMRQYGLSENCLKRLLNRSKRQEQGIAPNTIALMMPTGGRRPTEIWLMYQLIDGRKKIITAWRYPGASKPKSLPIPQKIIQELGNVVKF